MEVNAVSEISIVRGILTLILMLSFITLVVWLYARKNREAYADAALLPLEDDAVVSNQVNQVSQSSATVSRAGQSS